MVSGRCRVRSATEGVKGGVGQVATPADVFAVYHRYQHRVAHGIVLALWFMHCSATSYLIEASDCQQQESHKRVATKPTFLVGLGNDAGGNQGFTATIERPLMHHSV